MQDSLPLLSIHEGNPSLQPLIARFIASIGDRLIELRDGIVKEDRDAVKRAAHKFRGSASTFGFPQVSASIRRVEDTFLQIPNNASASAELASAYSRLISQCARLSSSGTSCQLDMMRIELRRAENGGDHVPKLQSEGPDQRGSFTMNP